MWPHGTCASGTGGSGPVWPTINFARFPVTYLYVLRRLGPSSIPTVREIMTNQLILINRRVARAIIVHTILICTRTIPRLVNFLHAPRRVSHGRDGQRRRNDNAQHLIIANYICRVAGGRGKPSSRPSTFPWGRKTP